MFLFFAWHLLALFDMSPRQTSCFQICNQELEKKKNHNSQYSNRGIDECFDDNHGLVTKFRDKHLQQKTKGRNGYILYSFFSCCIACNVLIY